MYSSRSTLDNGKTHVRFLSSYTKKNEKRGKMYMFTSCVLVLNSLDNLTMPNIYILFIRTILGRGVIIKMYSEHLFNRVVKLLNMYIV